MWEARPWPSIGARRARYSTGSVGRKRRLRPAAIKDASSLLPLPTGADSALIGHQRSVHPHPDRFRIPTGSRRGPGDLFAHRTNLAAATEATSTPTTATGATLRRSTTTGSARPAPRPGGRQARDATYRHRGAGTPLLPAPSLSQLASGGSIPRMAAGWTMASPTSRSIRPVGPSPLSPRGWGCILFGEHLLPAVGDRGHRGAVARPSRSRGGTGPAQRSPRY